VDEKYVFYQKRNVIKKHQKYSIHHQIVLLSQKYVLKNPVFLVDIFSVHDSDFLLLTLQRVVLEFSDLFTGKIF